MQNERQSNVGAKAVDLLTKEMFTHDWIIKGPNFLAKEVLTPGKNVLFVPTDIKSQLVRLLLIVV